MRKDMLPMANAQEADLRNCLGSTQVISSPEAFRKGSKLVVAHARWQLTCAPQFFVSAVLCATAPNDLALRGCLNTGLANWILGPRAYCCKKFQVCGTSSCFFTRGIRIAQQSETCSRRKAPRPEPALLISISQ